HIAARLAADGPAGRQKAQHFDDRLLGQLEIGQIVRRHRAARRHRLDLGGNGGLDIAVLTQQGGSHRPCSAP
ncbi:hypothetical protein HMPREF0175_1539, partial [Bifidobacterium longum subsp. longum ATCC 55813]